MISFSKIHYVFLIVLAVLLLGFIGWYYLLYDGALNNAQSSQAIILDHTMLEAGKNYIDQESSSGTFIRSVYPFAMQYRTTEGSLVPIDSSWIESEGGFVNTANIFSTRFWIDQGVPSVTVEVTEGRSFTIQYPQAQAGAWELSDAVVRYQGVAPETDVEFRLDHDVLIEQTIFHNPTVETWSWQPRLALNGLSWGRLGDAQGMLQDADTHELVFSTISPTLFIPMTDEELDLQSGELTTDVRLTYAQDALQYSLGEAGAEWISLVSRPVVLEHQYRSPYSTPVTGQVWRINSSAPQLDTRAQKYKIGAYRLPDDNGLLRAAPSLSFVSLLSFVNVGDALNTFAGEGAPLVRLVLGLHQSGQVSSEEAPLSDATIQPIASVYDQVLPSIVTRLASTGGTLLDRISLAAFPTDNPKTTTICRTDSAACITSVPLSESVIAGARVHLLLSIALTTTAVPVTDGKFSGAYVIGNVPTVEPHLEISYPLPQ
ncbi:MAG: hypothetical protein HZC01_01220 [Candidatus Kerfeldbacteria bacterium]|nr:hypothetical protein [Candidatus Kerfeldbacteria bacterium]